MGIVGCSFCWGFFGVCCCLEVVCAGRFFLDFWVLNCCCGVCIWVRIEDVWGYVFSLLFRVLFRLVCCGIIGVGLLWVYRRVRCGFVIMFLLSHALRVVCFVLLGFCGLFCVSAFRGCVWVFGGLCVVYFVCLSLGLVLGVL